MYPDGSLYLTLVVILVLIGLGQAAPAVRAPLLLSSYAPVSAACPSTPLVRPANGISAAEGQYYENRKQKATANLKAWLTKAGVRFVLDKYPVVALSTSGGGYRSLLTGAGVIQALDSRDSNSRLGGLYQALTYQSGLSGGAWLLSSLAGNDYPTITSLKNGLWSSAFQRSLLVPVNLQDPQSADAYAQVVADVIAKENAGFPPTITDPWGRLLSYQLLYGPDGGVSTTLSGVATGSNFSSFAVPFPLITARGVDATTAQCSPPANGTQYEFSPYEFGSWDQGVRAFTQTAYIGTSLSNGVPTSVGTLSCTVNYDNLGYVFGTSSHIFAETCAAAPPVNSTTQLAPNLEAIINRGRSSSLRDIFAVYPNPFYNYRPTSNLVASSKELYLVDGGVGEQAQNNPIWPLLHRPKVEVLIVNDNSADTNNFPDGTGIRDTYLQTQTAENVAIANRMPYIPPVAEFMAKGLNKRPTVFGCNSTDTSKLTIVYIPNTNYTFPSNQPTAKVQYNPDETNGMVDNGFRVATMNDDANWPTCLACIIMKKSAANYKLNPPNVTPKGSPGDVQGCAACYRQYCYN